MSLPRLHIEPTSVSDLADDLSNAKLFAGDTKLSYGIHNVNTAASEVTNDLLKINKWLTSGKRVSILIQLNKLRK